MKKKKKKKKNLSSFTCQILPVQSLNDLTEFHKEVLQCLPENSHWTEAIFNRT